MTAGTAPTQRTVGTMTAITHHRFGTVPEDVLRLEQVDRPTIGDHEVLVQVRAASVDRGTWHVMAGLPYLVRLAGLGMRRPTALNPGRNLAGRVAAVGSAVTKFEVGDAVFGVSLGAFAEYAAAREDQLAPKPSSVSFEHAAAVPVSALTALRALRDSGRVEAGHKVLIVGASGGVGTYAVQIAKALGAEVTGVCSTGKLDLVRSIGADHVVDYTREDFAGRAERYDLVLDIGGNNSLSRLRRALTPRGTLVMIGGEDGGRWTGGMGRQIRALLLSPLVGQRLTVFVAKETHADLVVLAGLIDAGQVTPVVDRVYPLHRLAEAIRRLDAGEARGKFAITV